MAAWLLSFLFTEPSAEQRVQEVLRRRGIADPYGEKTERLVRAGVLSEEQLNAASYELLTRLGFTPGDCGRAWTRPRSSPSSA